MPSLRMIAMPTPVVEEVRASRSSPGYGHPAHAEVAGGYGPCRHCLRTFRVGEERRLLFTYDPFGEGEPFPLPGPVYIHELACERYPEEAGFPEELRPYPLTLNAYGRGRRLRAQERLEGESPEPALERLLSLPDVDYVHVRDTDAGCFDLRVERNGTASGEPTWPMP